MPISVLILATALIASAPGSDAAPRIPGYGSIAPLTGREQRADPSVRYRLVFNVTKAALKPDMVNPSLEKVARLLNLLDRDGVRPAPGDLVVIVHGQATPIVKRSANSPGKRSETANPNLDLIAKLQRAGVTIAVCSQALHGQHIAPDDVAHGVRIDLSAMTTLAALQSRGWGIIPD